MFSTGTKNIMIIYQHIRIDKTLGEKESDFRRSLKTFNHLNYVSHCLTFSNSKREIKDEIMTYVRIFLKEMRDTGSGRRICYRAYFTDFKHEI